jgi:hypothetical protein
MSKIVRAQDILKEKGFVAPVFDTAAFQADVAMFFRDHSVEDYLLIYVLRFADFKDAPRSGFASSLFVTSAERLCGEVFIGYAVPPELLRQEPDGPYFGNLQDTEISRPHIIVDEPFAANAVGLLKMLGFTVGRRHKSRFGVPVYKVTLF